MARCRVFIRQGDGGVVHITSGPSLPSVPHRAECLYKYDVRLQAHCYLCDLLLSFLLLIPFWETGWADNLALRIGATSRQELSQKNEQREILLGGGSPSLPRRANA